MEPWDSFDFDLSELQTYFEKFENKRGCKVDSFCQTSLHRCGSCRVWVRGEHLETGEQQNMVRDGAVQPSLGKERTMRRTWPRAVVPGSVVRLSVELQAPGLPEGQEEELPIVVSHEGHLCFCNKAAVIVKLSDICHCGEIYVETSAACQGPGEEAQVIDPRQTSPRQKWSEGRERHVEQESKHREGGWKEWAEVDEFY
ncbi:unnamed protein product [Pleuronectes platessa]|uniref:Uncharacterized protein n=1 Tax=Pleuronectes platessa TaxID=8262 RepID=A0A9N7YMH7_PLEPL|nr:unnamed protein product [Pleuronectes platessa]